MSVEKPMKQQFQLLKIEENLPLDFYIVEIQHTIAINNWPKIPVRQFMSIYYLNQRLIK